MNNAAWLTIVYDDDGKPIDYFLFRTSDQVRNSIMFSYHKRDDKPTISERGRDIIAVYDGKKVVEARYTPVYDEASHL